MTYFLERIAKLLYEQSGNDLKNHCLVFPNRRAGLYFLTYLSGEIKKPVWTPAIMTVKEFLASFSGLQIAENEILLCELYKVYRDLNNSAETFDDFYFWGDMLAGDFDDIDKYLADAGLLFRNVQDINKIDLLFGDIEPEMAEIIKRFWKNFEPEKPSGEKTEFKHIWTILSDLYSGFRKSLRSQNLAYEGMLFRDVATAALSASEFRTRWETVHFIGFNALNKCEEAVMKRLQQEGKAKFYWDYDNSYIREGKLNSAGLFMTRNLKCFSNDMPDDWNYNTLLSIPDKEASVKIIETTSDVAQVKLIPELLERVKGISNENAHHTAVILADEGLLVPVLTSIPGGIGDINISMGYPLRMTSAYTLVRHILNLQRNARNENGTVFLDYRDVIDITRHQLIEPLLSRDDKIIIEDIREKRILHVPEYYFNSSENLGRILKIDFTPAELSTRLKEILEMVILNRKAGNADSPADVGRNLRNEFIYTILLAINRLESILKTPDINFKKETYIRILDSILKKKSVPFTGEPLTGVQIMGILETRSLDFENIILLSANEGILPAVTTASSFIPFSLREAFGLPTVNYQESIFAYHFYRLLHRAKDVTIVYNSNSDGLRTGEMSRFILQMKYDNIIRQEVLNLKFDIKSPAAISQEINRTDNHSARLQSLYLDGEDKPVLTPTAVNTWLYCRMMFYYRYVNGLKEPERIPGEIDHPVFGLILHRMMKNVYDDLKGNVVTREFIDSLTGNKEYLQAVTEKAFHDEVNPGIDKITDGNELIIRDILQTYLVRILKADRSITPFALISLETLYVFRTSFVLNGQVRTLRIGGKVDRIDRPGGKTRIVDYKTGEAARKIDSIEDLFRDDRKRDLDGWLQTFIYCEAFLEGYPDLELKPSIYRVREISETSLPDTLKIRSDNNQEVPLEDYRLLRNEFMEGLKNTLATIFNPDEPFTMTGTFRKCGFCPYRGLCQR